MGSPNPVGNSNMLPPAMPSPMPQLILASGQLVQGIQGAQLLIPTSQGTDIFLFQLYYFIFLLYLLYINSDEVA